MNIICKLQGGLGNQLFQYAYARRISNLFSNSQIYLDTSYFKYKRIRNLEINKYTLTNNIKFVDNSIPYGVKILNDSYKLIDKIYYKIYKRHTYIYQ